MQPAASAGALDAAQAASCVSRYKVLSGRPQLRLCQLTLLPELFPDALHQLHPLGRALQDHVTTTRLHQLIHRVRHALSSCRHWGSKVIRYADCRKVHSLLILAHNSRSSITRENSIFSCDLDLTASEWTSVDLLNGILSLDLEDGILSPEVAEGILSLEVAEGILSLELEKGILSLEVEEGILSLEVEEGIFSPFTTLVHRLTALRVGATRLENKTDVTRNIAEGIVHCSSRTTDPSKKISNHVVGERYVNLIGQFKKNIGG